MLSEIATRILTSVPTGGSTDLDAITRHVVADFGSPEPPLDARDLTMQHVLDLVAHGVLADDSPVESEPFTDASVSALRDALHHVISGNRSVWRLPPEVSGQQFVAAADRHRVSPTVAAALPVLDLPAASAARLTAKALQETATVEKLAVELAEIVTALEQSGVRVLVFKGLALAVQAHHDVAARGTGDHDLLVPPDDLERACAVLAAQGWVAAGGFSRPGDSWAWRRLVRDYYELPLVGGIGSIDLHWHLGPVRHAFPDFDVLWSRRATVSVGWHDVSTLAPYDALAHSATHTAKDHWRWLRGLLDVRLLMDDPLVWRSADRPLRQDQLLSVGLAERIFGSPAGAPPIIHEAAHIAGEVWNHAVERQHGPSHVNVATRVPGAGLYGALVALRRAGAEADDLLRQLSLSLLPLDAAAGLDTPSAWQAVPRVLAHRSAEIMRLSSSAARRSLQRGG
ncbi:nucleotidyltransferase domain-containing protein [Nocardioides sediminis]|uniref:nucleotidyltransferase domain-containing protein n=1 Tax=Nocardioides sediminis TaxID=433648 RepID=UPI00131EF2B3|nr:nucleotidyltransferase family protein [Nocardioides sediminis]